MAQLSTGKCFHLLLVLITVMLHWSTTAAYRTYLPTDCSLPKLAWNHSTDQGRLYFAGQIVFGSNHSYFGSTYLYSDESEVLNPQFKLGAKLALRVPNTSTTARSWSKSTFSSGDSSGFTKVICDKIPQRRSRNDTVSSTVSCHGHVNSTSIYDEVEIVFTLQHLGNLTDALPPEEVLLQHDNVNRTTLAASLNRTTNVDTLYRQINRYSVYWRSIDEASSVVTVCGETAVLTREPTTTLPTNEESTTSGALTYPYYSWAAALLIATVACVSLPTFF